METDCWHRNCEEVVQHIGVEFTRSIEARISYRKINARHVSDVRSPTILQLLGACSTGVLLIFTIMPLDHKEQSEELVFALDFTDVTYFYFVAFASAFTLFRMKSARIVSERT